MGIRNRKNSSIDRTNVDRMDRTSSDSRGDGMAGNEGIDEPSQDRTNRMSGGSRQQGRESMDDASSFSGQGGQRGGSDHQEGTGYMEEESNTDNSDEENPLA
jgi:hypothetical protein